MTRRKQRPGRHFNHRLTRTGSTPPKEPRRPRRFADQAPPIKNRARRNLLRAATKHSKFKIGRSAFGVHPPPSRRPSLKNLSSSEKSADPPNQTKLDQAFNAQRSTLNAQRSTFRVQSSEFRVQSSEFGVRSSEFGVRRSGKPSSPRGSLQCNSTYKLNIGISPVQLDLGAVAPDQLRVALGLDPEAVVDVLSAYPPCTGFSRANPENHLSNDHRNSLVAKAADFVEVLQPSVVGMANAREVIQGNFPEHFAAFRSKVESPLRDCSQTSHHCQILRRSASCHHEMATPAKDRSHWTVKKFTSHEDLRAYGIKEWQKQSGAARRQAAWELVYDYWVGLKKMDPNELRLQRVVTGIQRPRS